MELKIIDDDGKECPTLTPGELLARGTSIFRGYWNRPDANAETFVDGDWMRTGDVAYLDAEGFLFIVDRIKDLVIRGGENIGCGEVEAALLEHPSVHEASVYAVPDERLGEEVGTTLYTERQLSDEELQSFSPSDGEVQNPDLRLATTGATAAHGFRKNSQTRITRTSASTSEQLGACTPMPNSCSAAR